MWSARVLLKEARFSGGGGTWHAGLEREADTAGLCPDPSRRPSLPFSRGMLSVIKGRAASRKQ
jgi:hypothetical protein